MDILLKNGDIAIDDRGRPVEITGEDELVQRAMLRITTPKGRFALDSELGSTLHLLKKASNSELDSAAFACVTKALLPISGLAVQKAACTLGQDGTLKLRLDISAQGKDMTVNIG